MYKTKEELLDAYSKWDIKKVSEKLYLIQMRLFRIIENNGMFEFEALE
jgi:hypothetical protein